MDANLLGVGCPVHVVSNATHCGLSQLSINIDGIVMAIHNHFSIFTVRVGLLKDFCVFTETEFKPLLFHSKTRWLSLAPAVHRILELFEPLKSYFLSNEKAPIVLSIFFQDNFSELYLWLIHSYMSLFQENMKEMERKKNSVIEVLGILARVCNSLQSRIDMNFIPLKLRHMLRQLSEDGEDNKIKKFHSETFNMYSESLKYLKNWTRHLQQFEVLRFMDLKTIPEWKQLEEAIEFLGETNVKINDSILLDQFLILKDFLALKEKDKCWNDLLAHEKWTEFFLNCKSEEQFSELLLIAQFTFCSPGHNANVERIFSLISSQWTDERNKLNVPTINDILLTTYNLEMNCKSFYTYLLTNKELLSAIGSNDKYH